MHGEELGKEMNRSVDECKKKKMENFLSSVRREKMKMRKGSGTGKGEIETEIEIFMYFGNAYILS